jgi:hypothetical protein
MVMSVAAADRPAVFLRKSRRPLATEREIFLPSVAISSCSRKKKEASGGRRVVAGSDACVPGIQERISDRKPRIVARLERFLAATMPDEGKVLFMHGEGRK